MRAGAKHIAKALTENRALERLSLRLNRVGEEGGRALCEALCYSVALRSVNLSNNEMGPEAARMLADAMRVNQGALEGIDVSGNPASPCLLREEEGGLATC